MSAKIADMTPVKNPWWQTAKTPKQGFIMGGIWLLLGLAWVVVAVGEPTPWHWVLAALWTVGSASQLMSAVALQRRRRSAPEAPGR
ncbi:hypothetical protein ACFFWC_16030 [Plantactinospora siamensis]|uniref:DUF2530 domain-containing protein n=1 Tax=Plantactinospora siamensis TaxID=555372 RepID=A0ABV6NVK8_9ACTN